MPSSRRTALAARAHESARFVRDLATGRGAHDVAMQGRRVDSGKGESCGSMSRVEGRRGIGRWSRLLRLADVRGAAASFRPPRGATTLGAEVDLKGELRGDGDVVVLGRFEGDIVLGRGGIHVGPGARVDANITADAIVIAGLVRGNLSAERRVEILPTGSLTGTVKSGSFAAAVGSMVKGEIWVEDPDGPGERRS
jgi:cytoskeletal protein CcmA (bactofilin family)